MPLILLEGYTINKESLSLGGPTPPVRVSTKSRSALRSSTLVRAYTASLHSDLADRHSTEYTVDDGKGGKVHVNVSRLPADHNLRF